MLHNGEFGMSLSQRDKFLSETIVLDTETTGKDYKTAEIIEAGFVIKENGTWNIFQELHKPNSPIPPSVESICYITNEMVDNCPRFVDVHGAFQEILDGFKYLIAHNHFYDMKVLENHSVNTANHTWFCTWRMIKKLTNGDATVEATALPYLRFRYKLPVPIELICHRAGNDSFITALLLEYILDRLEESGVIDTALPYAPQLQIWLEAPIIFDRMPFGKHKGERMEDIPISYYQWALKNMDSLNESADNYDSDFAASVDAALQKILDK